MDVSAEQKEKENLLKWPEKTNYPHNLSKEIKLENNHGTWGHLKWDMELVYITMSIPRLYKILPLFWFETFWFKMVRNLISLSEKE